MGKEQRIQRLITAGLLILLSSSSTTAAATESQRTGWEIAIDNDALVAASVQETIHKFTGSEQPTGYGYQISDGGELTARYSVTRQQLLASIGNGTGRTLDLKYSLQGDIEYLTQASATFINHLIAEIGFGYSATVFRDLRLSYSAHQQTNEVKHGAGARNVVWGGLTINRRI